MTKKNLFALWGVLFILCAGLGFVPLKGDLSGAAQGLLTALSVLFFLPPAVLVYRAGQSGDSNTLKLVRNLSLASLTLTLVLLILNFATAFSSEQLGLVLHYVLVIVSSPMICSGHWAMSLFFWACLLMASLRKEKR